MSPPTENALPRAPWRAWLIRLLLGAAALLPGGLAWAAGTSVFAALGIAALNAAVFLEIACVLRARLIEAGRADSRRQRLKNLVEGSLQGILVHRYQKPLFVNQAFATIFGFESPEEVLQLESLAVLVAPRSREAVSERSRDRTEGKPVSSRYEFQGLRKDGRPVWIETLSMSVPWEGGTAVQATVIDITERKQAEETLRLSEVSHRALFETNRRILENSPAGIVLLDQDLRVVYENTGVRAMMGLEPNEGSGSIGLPLAQAPAFRDTPIGNLMPRLAQGRKIALETAFTNLRGKRAYLALQAVPILEEGALTGAVLLVTDVTDRRRYEDALRKQDLLLQALAEARSHLLSPVGLNEALQGVVASLGARVGVDHAMIFVNHEDAPADEARVSLRYEWAAEGQRAYLGDGTFEGISYRDSGFSRWYARLSAGQTLNDRVPELPDSERWLFESQQVRSVIAVPIFSGDAFWGFIGFADHHVERDWSRAEEAILLAIAENLGHCVESRAVQERLRESEERLARMTANIPGMVFQCLLRSDGSRCYPYVSPAGLHILGLTAAQLQESAEPMLNVIHPTDRLVFERLFHESARTLQPKRWEGRYFSRSGEQRWAQVMARPKRLANGDVLWDGLLLDITGRKRVELGLLRTSEREVTSSWSHEIAEEWLPALEGVRQRLMQALEELRPGDAAERNAAPETPEARLGEALRLIRQVLEQLRRPRPSRPPLALWTMLQEAIDRTLRGTNVEYGLDVSPDVDRIAGDADAIREVLGNLLVVALQALPDGGRIAIGARNVKIQGGGPAGLEPGHYVKITFHDERRELNSSLWRSLVGGDAARQPAGGGLAEVLALVTAERGWLTVQADPEHGALFTLYLKASALSLAPTPEEPSAERGSSSRAS